MNIYFNEKTREFHLQNNNISYIIKILKNNQLGHVYFGKNIKHRESFEHIYNNLIHYNCRPITSYVYENDKEFSLDLTRQEYPSYGNTDFREPAFQIKQENGSRITCFEYREHKIYNGKPKLKELPATYTEKDSEAMTLEVILEDKLINAEMKLIYTIFEDYDAIARSVLFKNNGSEKLILNRAMSTCIDFLDADFNMIQLSGAWGRERHIKTRKLQLGLQAISSTRGASSANQNPFIALKRFNTDENIGEVYGFSLVYSGNFLAQVEVDYDNCARLTMGINPFDFSWTLEEGEQFQTPEVVMTYSNQGLNYMSQTYHNLYSNRLIRGKWRDESRPVLLNNWEGTYFNFTEEQLLQLAKTSKELGIELFVLDDGWFGERNDDTSSLGDWYTNEAKLPHGIEGLAERIESLGLKFGLWFEPEMINKISNLYKKHPDWIIHVEGRSNSFGRNQFVLDFSRKEVADYIHDVIADILKKAPISYIKWDMNRSITEIGSYGLESYRQQEMLHRYILGVYDVLERLNNEFPNVLFESCASGGGRFDPGMLYYAPQAWTSDDTDAKERLKIQYGTSLVYPIRSMGAHVSASPNHQTGRVASFDTRANVACFGTFGYELDPTKLNEEEKNIVKEQIKFFKQNRDLLHNGDFYRLISPFEGEENITSWMVVSKEKDEAILGYYEALFTPNVTYNRIILKGLDPEKEYKIKGKEETYYGDELMNVGLILSKEDLSLDLPEKGISRDCYSKLFIIKSV